MTRGLRFPPFAKPGAPAPKPAALEEQLPPIEDFLDDLPSIDDFIDRGDYPPIEDFAPSVESEQYFEPVAAEPEEGWAAGSWQSYDWSAAAALNRSTSSAMDSSDAWSESEWPDPIRMTGKAVDSGNPSADEIADALDGIAHRIRSGDLVIDQLQGTRPEAAMAAALAILLRMRG
jgi:hypothetical protein